MCAPEGEGSGAERRVCSASGVTVELMRHLEHGIALSTLVEELLRKDIGAIEEPGRSTLDARDSQMSSCKTCYLFFLKDR